MTVSHTQMANAIRALAMDAVQQAKSGHPGMPMGMADVATVLFTRHLTCNPADPHWPDRDQFVLSAGHGSMLLYAVLHLLGYADISGNGGAARRGTRNSGLRRGSKRRQDRSARASPRRWAWRSPNA